VAVWSDQKLMQIAANNVAPNSRDTRSTNAPSKISYSTYSYSEESISSSRIISESGFGILGTKIATTILQYLDFPTLFQLRAVSKGIKELISTEADTYPGLRSIDMSHYQKRMDDDLLESIADFCGSAIDTLSLKGCWTVTNKAYGIIGTKIPNLRVLNMSSVWESTDSGLASLALSSLTTLDLSNCKKITDNGILNILDSCNNITQLEVSYCKFLTDRMFNHARWQQFTRLNLHRCTAVRDNAFAIWNTLSHTKVYAHF
jgi:hypothetical protein